MLQQTHPGSLAASNPGKNNAKKAISHFLRFQAVAASNRLISSPAMPLRKFLYKR
jgi:hypothetical protein